jgi:hypothetical protein
MDILENVGRGVKMQKKLLNYKELESGIIGMDEKEAQEYVNKNAIWSSTHLLFEQTNHDLASLTIDK